MTLRECPIKFFAQREGCRPAIVSGGLTFTYAELSDRIDRFPLPFLEQSIAPFFPRNQIEDILFLFACYRRHIIPFPLSFRIPLKRWASLMPSIPPVDEQACTYMATSGSSGSPKIARLSYEGHIKSAQGVIDYLDVTSSDRFLLSLPLFHVGGLSLLFRTFLAGATLILPGADWIATVARAQPTRLSLVPYQLKVLREKSLDLSFCRSILVGGQPLSDTIKSGSLPIVTSYGMTEMHSTVTAHWVQDSLSLGFPLKERALKIAEDGEIWVRGATRFIGYVGADPLEKEAWFPTGDLGLFETSGLKVIGRKDRQFISGGENIHPETIERAILALGEIDEVKVVPVSDPDYGFRPKAFISPLIDTDKLCQRLQDLLPKYMIPVHFELLEQSTKLSRDL